MTSVTSRRTFLVTGGILAVPLASEGQPSGQVSRIGFLSNGKSTAVSTQTEAFRRGLRDLGWVEG